MRLFLLLVLTALLPLEGFGDDFRVFTNRDGQEIRAKVVEVDGDHAVIEREDGRSFRFAISLLSESDGEFLRGWAISEAFRDEKKIGMRLRELRRGKRVKREGGALRRDRTESQFTFQLLIDNRTLQEFQDVTVEYVLFLVQADHGLEDGREKGIVKQKGELTFEKIARRSEVSMETDEFTLVAVEREERGPWNPSRNRYDLRLYNSEDRLEGIWVRVKNGDQVIKELSQPANLTGRFAW